MAQQQMWRIGFRGCCFRLARIGLNKEKAFRQICVPVLCHFNAKATISTNLPTFFYDSLDKQTEGATTDTKTEL